MQYDCLDYAKKNQKKLFLTILYLVILRNRKNSKVVASTKDLQSVIYKDSRGTSSDHCVILKDGWFVAIHQCRL